MKLREAILWQPRSAGRFAILSASAALVLLLAYLHTLAGLEYEFHFFSRHRWLWWRGSSGHVGEWP
jgi:uncharacterized protein (DUF58 family)